MVFVGNRKSAELFPNVEHLNADYPRSGPVSARIAFAHELAARLDGYVIDPDSRITQLGLVPVCAPDCYFRFPSRASENDSASLSELLSDWLRSTFGIAEPAFIAPARELIGDVHPRAAVSLGVGENDTKRVTGDFEARLLQLLSSRFAELWVDRGAGGAEAARVTAAASGLTNVRFWEGSFAGFASIISQSDFYAGYDSAGQHAAAAAGVPLACIFRGASGERFRRRWAASPTGTIAADDLTPDQILAATASRLPL